MYLLIILTSSALIQGVTSSGCLPSSSVTTSEKTAKSYASQFPGAGWVPPTPPRAIETTPPTIIKPADSGKKEK